METTLEYYLHRDVSQLSDDELAAKFEILKDLRAKEHDNSLSELTKLLSKR